jgi:HlyD family secretion protein
MATNKFGFLMKRIFTILIILILAASFFGTGFFLYNKTRKPAEVFETDSLFYTEIIKKTVATGSIKPRKEIQLKSQVSGVVEEIFVEPGHQVKNRQVVARIRIIPNVVQVNNAEMRVRTADINLRNAQREMERQKQLHKERVVSDVDFNQFMLQYELARQELEAAENNLELVKEGASKRSGAVSNLVYSTAEGMVLDVPVKEGSFVIESNTFNEGTTIAYVANMNEMIFEGKVDESEVGKIREGMELNLKIGALETEDIRAVLEYISPKGVAEEGAIKFEIKAAVALKEGVFLRSGYSANADIVLDRRDRVLAVRESNLIFEEDKIYVELAEAEQQFTRREIRTGLSDGIHIEIMSGLQEGDRIKRL